MPDLPRLAWFTPLPPERSGIATYSVELLPLLADGFSIDVFVAEPGVPSPHPRTPVFGAHDFVWKHARDPYGLVVYQLGNATCHDYMWAYLARYPGLVVLHDAQLHHARARSLLRQKPARRLPRRTRLRPPDRADRRRRARRRRSARQYDVFLADAAGAGSERRGSSRFTTHGSRESSRTPSRPHGSRPFGWVCPIRSKRLHADARRVVLERHGLSQDAVVFAAYGGVTPEKRIPQILTGFGSVVTVEPRAQLLLVGAAAGHYDALADARDRGVADHVTLVGYVNDREFSQLSGGGRRLSLPAMAERLGDLRPRGCDVWPPGNRRSSPTSRTPGTCRRW